MHLDAFPIAGVAVAKDALGTSAPSRPRPPPPGVAAPNGYGYAQHADYDDDEDWEASGREYDMGVSKNRGTPKSSILIGFSLINHPFWGYKNPYFWKHPYEF